MTSPSLLPAELVEKEQMAPATSSSDNLGLVHWMLEACLSQGVVEVDVSTEVLKKLANVLIFVLASSEHVS